MGEKWSTDETGLTQTLQQMKRYAPDGDYFALTLGVNRRGRPFWSAQTHWVAWSERHPGWEIRAASLIDPAGMARAWTEMGQGWVSVHDDTSLAMYLRIGGNALVEKGLAESRLPEAIAPRECMRDGAVEVGGFGFVGTGKLPDEAVKRRAPTRKLRMQVLKRDNYRCVVCGRRATDHTDLEIHVHHLVPWRMHGPTAEENLVTLCGTCHKGLDPDFEPSLRELAGLPGRSKILDVDNSEFYAEVERYREFVGRALSGAPEPAEDSP
ncbi:HNH endonuclease signature motif containing protein [Streptomyces sp. CT34]|uniref:HNH endonuclease n=1 Tax=Streptomyces sp. CT34 TaxID=1553907 RepID=UPI001F5211F0|nr:HNH endonuclease signature motif containing protein [Streptomyces sp. CT34]